jgi:hypothetical protein
VEEVEEVEKVEKVKWESGQVDKRSWHKWGRDDVSGRFHLSTSSA